VGGPPPGVGALLVPEKDQVRAREAGIVPVNATMDVCVNIARFSSLFESDWFEGLVLVTGEGEHS
jgi:hypothetical protein